MIEDRLDDPTRERHRLMQRIYTLVDGLELTRRELDRLFRELHLQPNPDRKVTVPQVLGQTTDAELRALEQVLLARCADVVAAKRPLREAWDRQHERRPLAKIEQERHAEGKRGTA